MKARVTAHENGQWVRDAAKVHAEKQQERKEKQAV